ncbi:MAG TPA: ABC transporter permease [Candidatus Acidoferrales bacterium]|nr:ABC transporter permease [Candidatus Acidoferrales bacterium]
MTRVGTVALNTFREAVRDRVLYNLVFFALVMMASAILVGQISIGIEQIVIVSLGLSAISIIGLLISVFIGVGLVSKEIDKRTLYALLAKPLRRWEFILGKFAGLALTLTVNTAAMAAGLFLALFYVKHSIERADTAVLVAVYFILLKLALVVALAMLFSCFTTPLLAILFTAGLYLAGLFVHEMRGLQGGLIDPALGRLLRWVSYVLPNFENFDVMGAAAHGRIIPATLVAQNTFYAVLYCAIVLTVAAAVFSQRNLK